MTKKIEKTEETNSFSFKKNIGKMLQLQLSPGNENDRYYVKLIGFLQDKSIIVTAPHDPEQPIRIPQDQFFVVRLMSGVSAQVFTAHAIGVTSHPYPHLHLSFPDKMESKNVRIAERFDCKIIATVQHENPDMTLTDGKSAIITNISTAGAQIYSIEELGNAGDKIILSSKIIVADLEEQYLKIPAIIRRVIEIGDSTTKKEYGLEFTFNDENSNDKDKLLLYGFLYEQMVEGIH